MTDSEKLDLLLSEMTEMKRDMTEMKRDMTEMKRDAAEMKRDVTDIKLHLENVTDKNIQTVAESHVDLSRKLNDALKEEKEKELLVIRVRILEDELRKVKERLDQIA